MPAKAGAASMTAMKHTANRSRTTRAWLLARGAELQDRIHRVRDDLGRQREPLPKDSPDAAIAVENDEVLRGIESTAVEELSFIDHALERLDAGTFGVCEACDGEIEPERLDIVPFATHCKRCARD